MQNTELWSVSPLDGRYKSKLGNLSEKVSEGALIGYRVRIEAEWLLHLAQMEEIKKDLQLSPQITAKLQELAKKVSVESCQKVKDIEKITNHDVKAVEYLLRDELAAVGANEKVLAFIHFACTSEDINNLAYGLMLKETRDQTLLPFMDAAIQKLKKMSTDFADLPMLSRTHGQTASPTTLGKEMAVFAYRLKRQREKLASLTLDGKISGAVGNYNAHVVAYPNVDWIQLAREFVDNKLGLAWNPLTTQIENHDGVVEYADILKRFNTVSIDLCRDIWGYVSLGYFKQNLKEGEVGSSTMPHKVNPIDFENAEGNFGISSALAGHFSDKLPISRWQRDLSDSTVLRSIGNMIGHSVLAIASMNKGLDKLAVNQTAIEKDLNECWEVLGEAIQTVMRRYGVMDAYERLKAATRGQSVTREALVELIRSCDELPAHTKIELEALTPRSYIGIAPKLAREFV